MKIKLPRSESLDRRLDDPFKKIRKGRRNSPNRFRVEKRASSFPICPRKYHIYRRLPPHLRPFEEESFISDCATLEGTALHLAVQKWFGIEMRDHAYGNWVCYDCRKIKRHALGIQQCSKCGKDMIYHEYAVKKTPKTPFTGHIDMLLWFDSIKFLIDFKGSSLDKMADLRQSGMPKYEHYLQTNAYSNAINSGTQSMGPLSKIDKIVIIYIDRGRPWDWKAWLPIQMPVSKRVYRETIALIQTAEKSLEDLVIPRGVCSSRDEFSARYCEVADQCFSPLLETILHDKIYPEDTRKQDRTLETKTEKNLRRDEGE